MASQTGPVPNLESESGGLQAVLVCHWKVAKDDFLQKDLHVTFSLWWSKVVWVTDNQFRGRFIHAALAPPIIEGDEAIGITLFVHIYLAY